MVSVQAFPVLLCIVEGILLEEEERIMATFYWKAEPVCQTLLKERECLYKSFHVFK